MRNWTIKDAVEEINKGNQEAIAEVAKHFPVAFMAIVKNDLAMLAAGMGDKFTLRRLDFSSVETDEDTDADDVMNAPEAGAEAGDEDLNAMSTKQLMALCDKRGIKVPHYGKNKQFYLDALQGASGTDEAEEAEEEVAEETTDAYEGKSAMELYKECKKRGIKAEQKKPAKYYIGLLKKADEAEAEEVEVEAEDEGWDDEEEEVPTKPTKGGNKDKGKKAEKPSAKAKAKEEAAEDDEDEEWDI